VSWNPDKVIETHIERTVVVSTSYHAQSKEFQYNRQTIALTVSKEQPLFVISEQNISTISIMSVFELSRWVWNGTGAVRYGSWDIVCSWTSCNPWHGKEHN
jgi:hypothetical protein